MLPTNANTLLFEDRFHNLLDDRDYPKIVEICELEIQKCPDIINNYWYLGLAYLLQEQEAEAQTTWLLAMSHLEEDKLDIEAAQLSQILSNEADRQQNVLEDLDKAWLIRQHLKEVEPDNLNNLLKLVFLAGELERYDRDLIKEWDLAQKVIETPSEKLDRQLLASVLEKVLPLGETDHLAFLSICLSKVEDKDDFITFILRVAIHVSHQLHYPNLAAKIAEVCLEFTPDKLSVLQHLSSFYSNADKHEEAISTARRFYDLCPSLVHKVLGGYLVMRALMSAGAWLDIQEFALVHQNLLKEVIETEKIIPNKVNSVGLLIAPFFQPYLQDNLIENRWFRNNISKIFQDSLQSKLQSELQFTHSKENLSKEKKLKIGYIASTLRSHSVGWLSRWLFHYHNEDLFDRYLYLTHQTLDELFTQRFFRDKVNVTYTFPNDVSVIATQIKEDEIDILVDLDSITLDTTCEVMAMKPAPIQVTWLGWDASGIPAIDYYIVDDYVLPENAQEHYKETLWRLPGSYVAVDGFEIGIPNITRDMLNIPHDAVTYLSAQRGYKRHPDTIKLQLQIIREVPNSYLLVKGMADETTIQQYFNHLAEEVGVSPDRLIFLGRDPDELVHRANLNIADVVLDTYPYNGATTTLETLWMCIPMVTRVGEQFAARNSYTFMKNAGIEEGIAWTDEEYVEWGIRLGKDKALRWEIAGKLRESRQTSPLWNAKKFTQEMENAYRQMWAKYVES